MTTPNPNLILYAQNQLGPKNIDANLPAVRAEGFTTIIFGMFHIGNEDEKVNKPDMKLGDIIFNGDEPVVVREGKHFPPPYSEFSHWGGKIGLLKGNGSTVTKIYASFGGAGNVVRDFRTIKTIYEKNGRSFSGTQLERNLLAFKSIFPAVDGIDMDCEETYDVESFVAFCELLMTLNFEITFCPYQQPPQNLTFWTDALLKIQKINGDPMKYRDSVKWWNLQCYEGGGDNDPQVWAQDIAKATNRPITDYDGYIMAGDGVRYWGEKPYFDEKTKKWITVMDWLGNCPAAMTTKFREFSKHPCLGGGFIWDMDLIAITQSNDRKTNGDPCPGDKTLDRKAYLDAMKKGLGS